MQLTNHAQTRMQQRGIDNSVLKFLDDFGRYIERGKKGSVVIFDKHAKALVRKNLSKGEFTTIEWRVDAYCVVSNEEVVITVGHQTKPICH